jgi:hypothetical protein
MAGRYMMLLCVPLSVLISQEYLQDQQKKNPGSQTLEVGAPQQSTRDSVPKADQRQLPKFDLPEYIIVGVASQDLPKVNKIPFEDIESDRQLKRISPGSIQREPETKKLELSRTGNLEGESNGYSGTLEVGIGSYFTPRAEFWFGQSQPNYQYILGAQYHLTNGYSQNTKQSDGQFTAEGRTPLSSTISLIQNAEFGGMVGYKSESYRFYGSLFPSLQRTISDIHLKAEIENQEGAALPGIIGISVENMKISDSSVSVNETRGDLNMQTKFSVASLPLQLKFHGLTANEGLAFFELSGGIQNYWYAGLLFEGSVHIYWAQGMTGQNLFRLYPHLKVAYPLTLYHKVFLSFEPTILPMTLASNIRVNRYLSASSSVRHTNISNAGELGVESGWTNNLQSRVSFGVKSISDLTMFTETTNRGIWTTTSGKEATVVTFCAEMVAKFESNDYFASTILLRSIKDSFQGKGIPYFPTVEFGFHGFHRLWTAMVVGADVRFIGQRQTGLLENSTVAGYAVMDIRGEYAPFDFMKLSVGIDNLTNTHYEQWRGYREFPLTMQFSIQVKW